MESQIACRCLQGGLVLVATLTAHAAHAAVGRTPGAPSVNADGEAAYSIPLALPPGTAGLTPALSLEYRHRTPGGLLGIGWAVGGLSQIARCPRTIAQDGISAPVSASADDRFCLDGRRLVVVNGVSYGAPGADYRTEIESFSRIRSYTGTGAGPQYFTVETADGRILEYGATPDSRQDGGVNTANFARIWALNRIRDRSGNVMDYQYVEDAPNADFYLSVIRYNANPGAGIDASHSVSFVYEDRPNSEIDTGYIAGSPVRRVKRLMRIDVNHQSSLVRRYELSYEPALTATGRSRLASVRECGADGGDCLAATNFSWRKGSSGVGAETSTPAAATGNGGSPDWVFNSFDLNGDGRNDLVWAGGTTLATSTIRFRLTQPDGTFGPETNSGVPSPYGIGMPFDHNGDGRTDLLRLDSARRWTVLPGASTGFGSSNATGIEPPSQLVDWRGADLNGDGLGDLVYSEIFAHTGNSLVVRVRHALATGGFSATPITLYEQATAMGYSQPEGGRFIGRAGERIDLDGNGAEDVLLDETYTIARIADSGWANEFFDDSYAGLVAPLDLNDDGCTDLVYPHNSGRMRARLSGCGINPVGPDLQGPVLNGVVLLSAADWNGDGRDDVLLRATTNWQMIPFRGDSFGAVADTGIAHNGATSPIVVDLNGDGFDDILTRVSGQARTRMHAGVRGDLLESATDGFGVTANFTYKPLTDPTVYTRGEGAVYPDQDLQSAAYVVSALATSDGSGTGALAATQYRYEQLRRHLLGRGSLGFGKRIVVDPAPSQSVRIEESRHQAFPLTGLPQRIAVRRLSSALLSDTQYGWTSLELGNRVFPYAALMTNKQYELDGAYAGAQILSTTQSVGAIDPASGLATDVTLTTTEIASGMNAGASATRRVTHTGVLNDAANWCLGRPQATQVVANHTQAGGAAITRSYGQTWDGLKCRPTQQRVEPGSSQWQVARDIGYDAFGNLTNSAVTGAGMAARATTVTWDTRGHFPQSVRNALGQTTSFAWDPATGNALSVSDPNTLTVSWTYDAHGNPVSEVRPDGTSTLLARASCTVGCDPRARAKVTLQERDNQGAVRATVSFELDQHGRAVRVATPSPGGGQSVSILDFDERGRRARDFLPFWAGGTPPGYWQYEYDAMDRPVSARLRDAAGVIEQSVTLRHDGLALTRTNARGLATTFTSNAWGGIVNVADPAGGNTSYEFDALGRLARVRDATGGEVSTAAYNAQGMLLTQTDVDLGSWVFTPNALGELIAVRDPRGQLVNFGYDPLGRLTSRIAPDGTRSWTWGTSASARNIGELAAIFSPGYSESYAYDSLGRPATHTINADSTYRYDYTYNSLGLLDTLSYPGTLSGTRFRIRHEYDGGAIARISDADVPATTFWQLNAQDAAGNVIDETLGAGARAITGFSPVTGEPEYRQTTAGSGAIQNLDWRWDANGNLTRRQDLNRGLVEEFRYDSLDRLDDARLNGVVNLDLAYDGIGNITWKSDVCPTAAPCFSYDANRRHAVTSAGGLTFSYDAAGNMTSHGGAAISWDSANLPTLIAHANGSNSRFWYGPDGNRWKQFSSRSGTSETTIYAGGLMEKVSRGQLMTWRHYVVTPSGTTAVHLRYSGGAASKTRYLTHDHLGSTDQILDPAGNVIVAESFGAFGERRGANWSGTPAAIELSAIHNATDDGFTGHEHLDHVQLIHMEGRVYDPRIGRFLSADPLIPKPYDGQSLNRYAYVWNNPLSFADPSGYVPTCVTEPSGKCARVTVIGVRDPRYFLIGGGFGGQVESAKQRDPCGQESDGYTCQSLPTLGFLPSGFVLSIGDQVDPDLSRSPTANFMLGATAQFANMMISSSPVTWLFGADPDFQWFEVPDNEAGRYGSNVAKVGVFVGGSYRSVRELGTWALAKSPRHYARWEQFTRGYAMDTFRSIQMQRGTMLFGALPQNGSPFFTTFSGFRRSSASSASLHQRSQMRVSVNHGPRDTYRAYLVTKDVNAAFGRSIRNFKFGPGGLPQVVVPSHETALIYLYDIPLAP